MGRRRLPGRQDVLPTILQAGQGEATARYIGCFANDIVGRARRSRRPVYRMFCQRYCMPGKAKPPPGIMVTGVPLSPSSSSAHGKRR
ncbi:hypothetical protein CHU32_06155 [Superficieibacter electus]|uniref:Uncharacterized protein n=1 Tax=Superficieibacter electus TaxID=2022662 RepID=A0A2P5GTD1_9ENTR|nr:hypothetical protein CHU33_06140 [Superficieibacter electus]POP49803.1 hypothetical protein CHU32_06155 [Superficieibacter electus]